MTDETERTPEDALPEAADAQGPTDLDAVATGIPDDDDATPFGEIVDEWSTLVRLRWPLSRVGPTHVHGITRSMLREGGG